MRKILFGLVATGIAASIPAHATPVSAFGYISATYVATGAGFAYRISLKNNGVDQLTTCANSFAYINASDDNYQVKVAELMTARAMGRAILVYMDKEPSNFCRIIEYSVP